MKTFSNKVHKSLKENKSISLKILLEEDEDKKSDDSSSNSAEDSDLFSDPSLDNEDEGASVWKNLPLPLRRGGRRVFKKNAPLQ